MPEPFVRTSSAVIPILGSNIDTDQICPARFLKITDKSGLADALFCDWRFNADGSLKEPRFLLDQPEMAGREIILAGDNFGCGSSREHAPWALRAWGIRAIIATSFADIFRNNALKNALLPIVVSYREHARLVSLVTADPAASIAIDLETQQVVLPDGSAIAFEVDPFARMMITAGTDEVGYVLSKLPAIETWEADHPARVETRQGVATG